MKSVVLVLLVFCIGVSSRAADPQARRATGQPVVENRWFDNVDGIIIKGEFIDLNTNATDRLYIRYSPISDRGVELERTTKSDLLWRGHVQCFGVSHSKYSQHVSVRIEDKQILVEIENGAQRIFETHDLKTGGLISREVTDVRR
jgi:hypothetical protein